MWEKHTILPVNYKEKKAKENLEQIPGTRNTKENKGGGGLGEDCHSSFSSATPTLGFRFLYAGNDNWSQANCLRPMGHKGSSQATPKIDLGCVFSDHHSRGGRGKTQM
jgi:hypothetical protein